MDGQGIPSVRLSLAVVAGMKKPNDHEEPTKVERYKKERNGCHKLTYCTYCGLCFVGVTG